MKSSFIYSQGATCVNVKDMHMCENTTLDLSTLDITCGNDVKITYIANGIALPNGEKNYTLGSVNVNFTIQTEIGGEIKFNYFTIFVYKRATISKINLDTTVCVGDNVNLFVDVQENCDQILFRDKINGEEFVNGSTISIPYTRTFLILPSNEGCGINNPVEYKINALNLTDSNTLAIQSIGGTLTICPGEFCIYNLNDKVVVTGADSIEWIYRQWSKNGVNLDSIITTPPSLGNIDNYTLNYSAILYKKTNCGIVVKHYFDRTINVSVGRGNCDIKFGWEVPDAKKYLCQDYTFYVSNPQKNQYDFGIDDITFSSLNGANIQFKEQTSSSNESRFFYTARFSDEDVITAKIRYYDNCSQKYDSVTLILNFEYSLPIFDYKFEWCRGDSIRLEITSVLEELILDSIDFLSYSVGSLFNSGVKEYQEPVVSSKLTYISNDVIFDFPVDPPVIAGKLNYTWCGDTSHIDLVKSLDMKECMPEVIMPSACWGDTNVISITEYRFPKSIITDILINFPQDIMLIRVDTTYYKNNRTNDSIRIFNYVIISYNAINAIIPYEITYKENGVDTTIIDNIPNGTMRKGDCPIAFQRGEEQCSCSANQLTIFMGQANSEILSIEWQPATYKYIVDSINAIFPPILPKAQYKFLITSSATQYLSAYITYSRGDSIFRELYGFTIYTKNCRPTLTSNGGPFCRGENISFFHKPNLESTNVFHAINWLNSPNPVEKDLMYSSTKGDTLYQTKADKTMWYYTNIVMINCFDDTVVYVDSFLINVTPPPRVFKDSVLYLCQNDILDLWDYISSCVNDIKCDNSIDPGCTGDFSHIFVPVGLGQVVVHVTGMYDEQCLCGDQLPQFNDSIKVIRDVPAFVGIGDKNKIIDSVCTGHDILLKVDSINQFGYITWIKVDTNNKTIDTIVLNAPIKDTAGCNDYVIKEAMYYAIVSNSCNIAKDSFYLSIKPTEIPHLISANVCVNEELVVSIENNPKLYMDSCRFIIGIDTLKETIHSFGIQDTYYFSILTTGLNGCTYYRSDTVIPFSLPIVSIYNDYERNDDTTICASKIIDVPVIMVAMGAQTYKWLSPESVNNTTNDTIKLPILIRGVYSVEGTDSNGCKNIASVYVIPFTDTVITKYRDTSVCENTPLTINVDASLSNVVDFIWTLPNGSTLQQETLNIPNVSVADTGKYVLYRGIEVGCYDTTIIHIGAKFIRAKIWGDTAVCRFNSINIYSDNKTLDAFWKFPSGDTTSIERDSLKIDVAELSNKGIYTYYMSFDECSDSLKHSVRVDDTVFAGYNILPDKSFYCDYDDVVFLLSPNNGDKYYVYLNGGGISSSTNIIIFDDVIPLLAQDSGIFHVRVDRGICTDTAMGFIDVRKRPVPIIQMDSFYCVGDTIIVTIQNNTGITDYLWTYPDGITTKIDDNITFDSAILSHSGNYILSVTNVDGCVSFDTTFKIDVRALPILLISENFVLCEGDSLTIDATDSKIIKYLWTPDGTTNAYIIVKNPGVYLLQYSDENCSNQVKITVDQNTKPIFELGNDTVICFGDELQLDIDVINDNILWSDGTTGTYVIIDTAGKYYALVELNNCFWSDTINISNRLCVEILFPNAFMPTSAQIDVNKTFKHIGILPEDVVDMQFYVYNQWGHLLFQTDKCNEGWDGNFNGNPQPAGAYVFKAVVTNTYDSDVKTYSGSFVLIR
ncbi:hypothetical protein FACS1894153_0820 [Bacteroidia bacterium]|nr:hypothetical protein FACS1894153_0820 [Bacteroidia bacterium]